MTGGGFVRDVSGTSAIYEGVDSKGHLFVRAPVPTVTGTGCALVAGGNDVTGMVTAAGVDTCVVTFYASYTNPMCVTSSGGAVVSLTGSAFTFTTIGAANIVYACRDIQ
jgi:hypothetical protein